MCVNSEFLHAVTGVTGVKTATSFVRTAERRPVGSNVNRPKCKNSAFGNVSGIVDDAMTQSTTEHLEKCS